MPNFEQSQLNKKNHEFTGGEFNDKIICLWTPVTNSGMSVQNMSHRAKVGIESTNKYTDILESTTPDNFINLAGCDLTSIFMPFQLISGYFGMPGFHQSALHGKEAGLATSGIISYTNLMPYNWDITQSSFIYDRFVAPSGDTHNHLISSSGYYHDVDRFRDVSDIRSIGIRLPMMGVGWGYTMEGTPWPSGTSISTFAGAKQKGWQVDPKDYAAAPIDLRYDTLRNVWSAPREGFWAEITAGSGIGPYLWKEKIPSIVFGGIVGGTNDILPNVGSLSGYGSLQAPINAGYSISWPMTPITSGTHVFMRYTYFQIGSTSNLYIFEPPSVGVFPVVVYQNGGNDGTFDSPATWTYDIRSVDGLLLGQQLALATPRPPGSTIYQPSGMGIAMYINGVLQLMDAGEIPNVVYCQPFGIA